MRCEGLAGHAYPPHPAVEADPEGQWLRGRINPATYQADPTLRQLIDVVPYGLPAGLPVATKPMIKGVWPGIAPTDKVVLWGGGLWPWLDPLTAIHAIHHLAPSRPEIKLIFPGTRHPNPNVATMRNNDKLPTPEAITPLMLAFIPD